MSDAIVRLRGHAELGAESPSGAAATVTDSELEWLHVLLLRCAVFLGETSCRVRVRGSVLHLHAGPGVQLERPRPLFGRQRASPTYH